MNSEQFSEALEQISGPLIEDAALAYDKTAKRRRKLLQFMPRVCAAILTLALLTGLLFSPGKDPEIITAPGILKVYAYDLENADGVDVAKLEGIELEEGVEFPSNIGWGIGINLYPGLPITLSMPEDYFSDGQIEFQITVDGGEFFRKFTLDTGFHWWGGAYLGQEFTLENKQTIYWHFIETDSESVGKEWDPTITDPDIQQEMTPQISMFKGEKAFAEVTILADNNIVGATLIEIYADETKPMWYQAKVVKSVCYPQLNGAYQKISQEYVNKQMDNWKTE